MSECPVVVEVAPPWQYNANYDTEVDQSYRDIRLYCEGLITIIRTEQPPYVGQEVCLSQSYRSVRLLDEELQQQSYAHFHTLNMGLSVNGM